MTLVEYLKRMQPLEHLFRCSVRVCKIYSLENVVCYRKDNPVCTRFLSPPPCFGKGELWESGVSKVSGQNQCGKTYWDHCQLTDSSMTTIVLLDFVLALPLQLEILRHTTHNKLLGKSFMPEIRDEPLWRILQDRIENIPHSKKLFLY